MQRIFLSFLLITCLSTAYAEPLARAAISDIFIIESPNITGLQLLSLNKNPLVEEQNYQLILNNAKPENQHIAKFTVTGSGAGGFEIHLQVGVDENQKCDIDIIEDSENELPKAKAQCDLGYSFDLAFDDNIHLIIHH